MDDNYWMQYAYEQAVLAKSLGEVPVGAVLISADQQLLGLGHNGSQNSHDPSDHAEMKAIRQSCQAIKNHRLLGTTLYVTLEPCIMCAGVMIHARIHRLVFATRDFKSGAAGSVFNILSGSPLNHRVSIDEGVMQSQCAQLLSDFFKACRK